MGSFLEGVPILKRMLEIVYTMFLVIVLSALVGLIMAFPVMWLWNFVFVNFPNIQINVFQAWALNVLAGILFGSKSGSGKRK